MMFSVADGSGSTKLVSTDQATLVEFQLILKSLDWDWWKRENPSLWTAGEAAMRVAYQAAELRGPEFQNAFLVEFKSRNPGMPAPVFGTS